MELVLSEEVLSSARTYLESQGPITNAVSVPLGKTGLLVVISPNHEDMIALAEVEHEGVTYYLGPPQL